MHRVSPVGLLGFVLLCGCMPPPGPEPEPEPELVMPRSIVDLSPAISPDLPTRAIGEKTATTFSVPLSLPFKAHVGEEPFYISMSEYTIFSHVGPHYDPPNHIIEGGASVDEAPLEKFYGRARLFDFRDKTPGEPLLRSDFDDAGIEPDAIVIAFVGYRAPEDPEAFPVYPYLSGEAAEYLAKLPIKAFASDMPSLGSITGYLEHIEEGKTGSENILPEHYALLSRGIPNIEGLVNLENLVGEDDIVFVGFPLKFENGDGGPMRAVALVY